MLLLPLVTTFGPTLIKWLLGPKAGTTASAIGQVVQSVTGHDVSTADGVTAALADATADSTKADALRVQFAQIEADAAAAERKAELDAVMAQLADVASARAQTVALAQAHSATAYGAPVVSTVVLLTFAIVMYVALTRDMPAQSAAILNMLMGTLATMAVSVVSFWVGSSAGSARKDATIASAQTALANSTPVSPPGN